MGGKAWPALAARCPLGNWSPESCRWPGESPGGLEQQQLLPTQVAPPAALGGMRPESHLALMLGALAGYWNSYTFSFWVSEPRDPSSSFKMHR